MKCKCPVNIIQQPFAQAFQSTTRSRWCSDKNRKEQQVPSVMTDAAAELECLSVVLVPEHKETNSIETEFETKQNKSVWLYKRNREIFLKIWVLLALVL